MTDETPAIRQPDPDRPGSNGPDREEAGPPPRRLERSGSDRVLLGVAGGLGRYFGIDPVIFRIGFGVSIFFGGLGLLAYALLAIFVPTDGEPDTTQRMGTRLRELGIWKALGLAALVALSLFGLLVLAGGAAFAVAVGWGVPIGIAIVLIGGALVFAAFRGGARWLVLPAAALALGAGTAAASDLDFRGGVGEREYRPLSAAGIPADGYRLGVGRLVVDLRDLDWGKRQVIDLSVDLGAGQASVFVPSRVCVTGSTHVGAGESEVVGERNSGADVDHEIGARTGTPPRLAIDADVQMGQLRVINSDTADVDTADYDRGPFDQEAAPLRAAQQRACAA